eukprot:272093-Prymnesium_polylepis.1
MPISLQFGALPTDLCAPVCIAPPYGARSALREAAERAGVRVRRRIGIRSGLESLGLSRLRVLWPGRRRVRPSGRARGYPSSSADLQSTRGVRGPRAAHLEPALKPLKLNHARQARGHQRPGSPVSTSPRRAGRARGPAACERSAGPRYTNYDDDLNLWPIA